MLSARLPQAALKRGFAVFLFAVGGLVLFRSRDSLHVRSSGSPPAHAPVLPSATTAAER